MAAAQGFFQNALTFLLGPNNGNKVTIGGVPYYTADLMNVTSFANDNDVVGFVAVNPYDPTKNESWQTIPAGQNLGAIITGGVIGPDSSNSYLKFQDAGGNQYFVSLDTLTNTDLVKQGVLNVAQRDAADNKPSTLEYAFIAVGVLLFLGFIIVLVKVLKEK